jgi:sterol desaturase/sphingolipid hydroxylase (fatty acid hydroxylase superfamily)
LVELVRLETADYATLQWRAIATFFSLCIVEGLLTKPRPSPRPTPDLVADMFYWLVSPMLRMASRILLLFVLVAFALTLGHQVGPHLFQGFGPLARQPLWLCTIELLVLMDLSSYWSHRMFHTVPWLWRFHAIHHSAKTMRWATTARVHPVNEVATYLTSTVPFFLVGFPLKAAFPLLPWAMAFALCAHTQWNLSFGWLGNVFVSPRFHRWHHSHSNEGGNSNFGNIFSFWDRLFGTRYYPEGRRAEVIGLDVDDCPESYLGQLAYPFRPRGAHSQVEPLALPQRERSDAQRSSSRSTRPVRDQPAQAVAGDEQ